ncbi:MAG: 30S ribosomal protein S24e [Candidatus Diapherotrites archaeon]|jgi:ribosomal protein S24E|uniref:30S ribosomal protein S24e n=1 Tax=Candidatus Iainarchaeum sp. TaxID=3101447 RepID=A0A7K4BZF2_9ARCH|nr:30S ribosomal protein S24e [Candidatus Diapherotrites archaeon]
MDLKITQNKKNELLKRAEIIAEGSAEKVPSRNEVREKIAALTNTQPETIVVIKIENKYGSKKLKILAHAYSDKASMKLIENKKKLGRNFEEFKKGKTQAKKGPAP